MRWSMVTVVAAAFSVVQLVGCFGGSDSGNPAGPPAPAGDVMIYEYRNVGGAIELISPDTVWQYSYCDGSRLVIERDTSDADTMVMAYELSGNTLKLAVAEEVETLEVSGAVVGMAMVLSRVGAGSELIGTWTFTGVDFRVLSGTPTTLERAELDSAKLLAGEELGSGGVTLQFTNSVVYVREDYDYAEEYIDDWTESGPWSWDTITRADQYAITLTRIDKSTVRLLGQKSGEQVTVTINSRGDMTFTSSVASHAAYTYYENPTACPNDDEPAWFPEFLQANAKTGLTKAVARRLPPARKRTGCFVVTTIVRFHK